MITELRVTPRTVKLPRPWGPDVPVHHVLVCEVTLADGRTGTGFCWTPQIGAAAVRALLENDIRAALLGLDPHPEVAWDRLWRHLREAGGGGVTTIALAGVDMALWDLHCGGRGLADVLGRRRAGVEVYGSGVNRHYSLEELVAQAERWKARGYRAVKIKVGLPDLREDVERVAAVREVLGPEVALMIDANQLWDLYRARRAVEALAPYGLHWLEEPLPAGDVVGENVYTGYGFRDLITAGACDVVQPNVVRVGGITPFLRIAELAAAFDVPVYPHLLPEVSGQLALALPLPCMVEDVEDASFAALGLLAEPYPVTVDGVELRVHDGPGLGLHWT